MIVFEQGEYVFINNKEDATFTRQYRFPVKKTTTLSLSKDDIRSLSNWIMRYRDDNGEILTESAGSPDAGGVMYIDVDNSYAAIVYDQSILSKIKAAPGDFVLRIKGTITPEFLNNFNLNELLPKFSFHSFMGHALGITAAGGSTPMGSGCIYSYPKYKYDAVSDSDCIALYKGQIIGVIGPKSCKNYGIPVASNMADYAPEDFITIAHALRDGSSVTVNTYEGDGDEVWLAGDQPSLKSAMTAARHFSKGDFKGFLRHKPLGSGLKYMGVLNSAVFPDTLQPDDEDKVTHVILSEDTFASYLISGDIINIGKDLKKADLLLLADDFSEIISQYNERYLAYQSELMKLTFDQISVILSSARQDMQNQFRSRLHSYINQNQKKLLEPLGIANIALNFNPMGAMGFKWPVNLTNPTYTGDDVTDAASLISRLQYVIDPALTDCEKVMVVPSKGLFFAITNSVVNKELLFSDVKYCPFCMVAGDKIISPVNGVEDYSSKWEGFVVKDDGLYDEVTDARVVEFTNYSYVYSAFRPDLVGDLVVAWANKFIFGSEGLEGGLQELAKGLEGTNASSRFRTWEWKRWWKYHDTFKGYSGKVSRANFKMCQLSLNEVNGHLIPVINGIWSESGLKYCQRGSNYDEAVTGVLQCMSEALPATTSAKVRFSRCSDTGFWTKAGDFMGGKVLTVLSLGLAATWNSVGSVPFSITMPSIKFNDLDVVAPEGSCSDALAAKLLSAVRSGAALAAYAFVRPKLDSVKLGLAQQTAIARVVSTGATVPVDDIKKVALVDEGYLTGLKALLEVLKADTPETAQVASVLQSFYNSLVYLIGSDQVPVYIVEQGDLTSGGEPIQSNYAVGLTLRIKGEI